MRLFAQALDAATGTSADRDAIARRALGVEASAFDWLEDSEWEEAVHSELHTMGRTVNERFPEGCHLDWNGAGYEHRCPIPLAHLRWGFSPSLRTGKKVCIICQGDASECPHLPGQRYPVTAGRDDRGRCNICLETACEHQQGVEYMMPMRVEITEILAGDHLAVVPRPVQVDTRLGRIPFSVREATDALGPGFTAGTEVLCLMCRAPCTGLQRMPSDPRLHGRVLPPQCAFDE
jgi:hypothetical protein